jgi:hypothetical protein
MTDPRISRLARKIRRQLLQFRLLNFGKLEPAEIPGCADLRPRTRDLLKALSLPFREEKEICDGLLLSLKGQQSLRTVLSVNQSAVLDCLVEFIHDRATLKNMYNDCGLISMVDLAQKVSARLQERGELGSIAEKKLGNILTSISLTNRFRLNTGWVLLLDRNTREEIHSLARAHGTQTNLSPEITANCDLCQHAGANQASNVATGPGDQSSGHVGASTSNSEHGEHRERGNAGTPRTPVRRVRKPTSKRRS